MLQAYLKCFMCMLQVFHVDVAYVAMAIDVCYKCIVPNVLAVSDVCCKCFFLRVTYVSHICCKCLIRMLHMFHTYVASVSSGCCICFAMATHVFSFNYFGCKLQVFHLNIAKVDMVLHML